jgi:tripartite-type tricarboxylate transporter receptor subunit TctC
VKRDSLVRHSRLIAAAFLALAAAVASAQDSYPTKPIRLIVPSSPGGGTDTTARAIAPRLTERLGQQIVVENRPGAAAMIGTEYVARSAPDGYTIVLAQSTITIVPSIYKKIRFDPIRDFEPITNVVVVPQTLVGHPSLPVKNAKELVAFAKANPGKLDYAAGAYGGNPHLSMALFLSMSGTSMNYVPYKSGNAGLTEALAGEVPLMMGNILAVLPHVKGGKLRAYGVTSAKRASAAPEIPTLAEAAAVPGYEALQWFGLLAPAGTPRPIVERLHRETLRVIELPDVQKFFATTGGDPQLSATPEAFGALMRAEIAKWAKVVKQAGIKEQ